MNLSHLLRTNSDHPDFRILVKSLDEELADLYGEKQMFYNQFNSLSAIQHVVVYYNGTNPVGCGAIKKFDDDSVEVKRMFVIQEYRNKGIAHSILQELERWAKELGYKDCILETGDKQPFAVHLYQKAGYTFIPNYGQYHDDTGSICMKKKIQP
ncbi:MAG: GNAT family N-acetyltransferase [Saprospiraceae bacterium]